MSIEEARAILSQKDVSTKEKYDLFMKALQIVSGNAFQKQN